MRKPYPVYEGAECPVCGNTEGHRDHGPYDEHPLDAELGGTPPETVHLMTCGRCHKCFDAEPEHPGGPVVHRPVLGPPSPLRSGFTVLQGGQS